MSRTYRNPKFLIETNIVEYINKELEYFSKKAVDGKIQKTVRVRKTKEKYELDIKNANIKYENDLAEYKKIYGNYLVNPDSPLYSYYINRFPRKYYVSKFFYETILVEIETEIKNEIAKFYKRTRDGYWNESGRNKAYKNLSKKEVRRKNKILTNRIMKDEDYDHLSYPDTYLGKKHIWSVW